MSTPSPPFASFPSLEQALRGIELAGGALSSAPRGTFDLRPAARALELAARRILDAYDARAEAGAALDEAAAACDTAKAEIERATVLDPGLAPTVTWIVRARGWLGAGLDEVARAPRLPPTPRAVMASRDAPRVHLVERPSLSPSFDVAPPLPPPAPPLPAPDPALPLNERMALLRRRGAERRAEAAALRAERSARRAEAPRRDGPQPPAEGFVPGSFRALGTSELVGLRARELFEEIAAMGALRLPLLGDPWRSGAIFDDRLFAALDALAALGRDAVELAERFVTEAPAKDPSRAFAVALTFGSLEGRDSLAALERALRHLGLDDDKARREAVHGLSLAPHPGLGDLLRRWLVDDDPATRAVAVEALARRGDIAPKELARALADDDARVIEKALIPAAYARVPELTGRASELEAHTHEGVTRALAWASVLGDLPFAIARLTGWLGTPREEAALLPLALAGDLDDARRLVALAASRRKKARLVALGWSGVPDAIPVLLRTLTDEKDDELRLAAAFALDRLTGAGLYEDALVPPRISTSPSPKSPRSREGGRRSRSSGVWATGAICRRKDRPIGRASPPSTPRAGRPGSPGGPSRSRRTRGCGAGRSTRLPCRSSSSATAPSCRASDRSSISSSC
jgi:hypothetical protein